MMKLTTPSYTIWGEQANKNRNRRWLAKPLCLFLPYTAASDSRSSLYNRIALDTDKAATSSAVTSRPSALDI